jgi:Amt family ammonium transporter
MIANTVALVFIMTPGLGLFYAGMVKRKNTVATMMQSMAAGFIVLIQVRIYSNI